MQTAKSLQTAVSNLNFDTFFLTGLSFFCTVKATLATTGWTFGQVDGFSNALKKLSAKMRTMAMKHEESNDPVLAALKRKVLRPPKRSYQYMMI